MNLDNLISASLTIPAINQGAATEITFEIDRSNAVEWRCGESYGAFGPEKTYVDTLKFLALRVLHHERNADWVASREEISMVRGFPNLGPIYGSVDAVLDLEQEEVRSVLAKSAIGIALDALIVSIDEGYRLGLNFTLTGKIRKEGNRRSTTVNRISPQP